MRFPIELKRRNVRRAFEVRFCKHITMQLLYLYSGEVITVIEICMSYGLMEKMGELSQPSTVHVYVLLVRLAFARCSRCRRRLKVSVQGQGQYN